MKLTLFLFLLISAFSAVGQDYRPGLFFREDFKETPAEIPISQKHLANPDVLFSTYGPGQDSLKKSHHEKPVDDPYYMWTGLCIEAWAVSFSHKSSNVDLSSFAKIRWRTKQAGFHELRILLKAADGTWMISDISDGPSADWRVVEFNISDINWWLYDMETMKEKRVLKAEEVDLSNIEAIGCTDLMPGGRSNACSRLDWIEVYGSAVPRP